MLRVFLCVAERELVCIQEIYDNRFANVYIQDPVSLLKGFRGKNRHSCSSYIILYEYYMQK
jgi:hypothetical protein